MVIFHGYVNVYQRVPHPKIRQRIPHQVLSLPTTWCGGRELGRSGDLGPGQISWRRSGEMGFFGLESSPQNGAETKKK